MFIPAANLTQDELVSAIIRNPLVVPPDMTVMEAIAEMSGIRALCQISSEAYGKQSVEIEARSSCVIIVKNDQPVGILTERDVVRLITQKASLKNLPVCDVMTRDPITLRESELSDLFVALELLRKHKIRHLLILDKHDGLVGLLTHESLRQVSRPVDLLRLRAAEEVMTTEVVCAAPHTAMQDIACLMIKHRVSSVVIVQTQFGEGQETLERPIGIVTERDIVQFQALGLDFDSSQVQVVMSTPIFSVQPDESLLVVQQMMAQYRIQRLVVTDSQGGLCGIVTQTSLLQALNPLELYNLAKVLEKKVLQLESEKIQILESRTISLEKQVEERTTKLKATVERERLIATISRQIRSSLDLPDIFKTTVEEVRQVLGCDRVVLWRFQPNMSLLSVAESNANNIGSQLGQMVCDPCVVPDWLESSRQGRVRVVSDIYTTEMADCHRQFLEQLHIRAKILIPILQGDTLWGLLEAIESEAPRLWQSEEVELLEQLATQLAIAIQQASTHQKLQQKLKERQQLIAQLQDSEKRYATLTSAASVGIFRTNAQGECVFFNEAYSRITTITIAHKNHDIQWTDLLHPGDRERVLSTWIEKSVRREVCCQEFRLCHPGGEIIWVYSQVVPELDSFGQFKGYVGTMTDITPQKESEAQLQQSERFLEEAQRIAHIGNWSFDLGTQKITWSTELFRMFGLDPNDPEPSYADYLQYCIHPEDRLFLENHVAIAIAENKSYVFDYRAMLPDGTMHYHEARGNLERDHAGNPQRLFGTVIDITERKTYENQLHNLNQTLEARVLARTQELRAREIELFDLFDNATDLIQSVSLEGKLLFVNRAWEQTLGYSQQELAELSLFQIIHPDNLAHYKMMIAHLCAGDTYFGIETRFLSKDGKEIILEGNVNCQFQDGQAIATRGIFRDITARKQAEEALKISEARFRNAFDTTAVGMCLVSSSGGFLKVNPALCNFWGYSETELLKMSFQDITHPDDLDNDLAFLRQLLAGKITHYNLEKRYITKDQRLVWGYLSVSLVKDSQGKPLYFVSQIQDISDRKQTEIALQKSEERFRRMFDSSVAGMIFADFQGNIIDANDRFLEMLGYTREELETGAIDWLKMTPPEYLARDYECMEYLIEYGEIAPWEKEYYRKDGSRIAILMGAAFLQDTNSENICVIVDISDRKQAELQLQQTSDRLTLALNSGAIGYWEWDIQQNILVWDDRMHELYENLEKTNSQIPYELWANAIHPDDRNATEMLLQQAVLGEAEYDCEFRVIHPDRSIHFIKAYGKVTRDTQGNAQSMIGINFDITAQKQAEQTIRHQSEKETILRQITQHIRATLDLQNIFDTACQEIRQFIKTDRVGIFKFVPDSGFYDGAFVAESVQDGLASVLAIPVHDHCFGADYAHRYAQGHFQAVSDVLNSELQDCHKAVLAQFQVRANLVIPLLRGKELWGLLCIHTCTAPRVWEADEIDLLQQIASQLAIAIQQGNLYNQIQAELITRQRTEEKIVLELRRQQLLGEIIQSVRDSFDMAAILVNVTHKTQEILNGDRVIVFQLFPDGRSKIAEESVSDEFPSLKNLHWDNEVWSQEVLDHHWQGIPRIVPDVMHDRWTDCLVEYSSQGQIQSKIVAPILQEVTKKEDHRWVSSEHRNRLWGVLVVHACGEKRVWQDQEAEILQQIANQLAIAIQQADLFEQLQQEQQKLTQTNEALAHSNEDLARATRLKDEFLANMSHELRTPLNAILGMAEGLQERVFGKINEQQVKALRTIERSGLHLLSLINDILDVAKIESGQIQLEYTSVAVTHLCSSSLVFVKQQALQKRVRLETEFAPDLTNAFVDERRIRQVLINLLTNAVKFTPEGGTVTLTTARLPKVDDATQQHYLRIAVSDTGIGIAPENINKLFQPFVQIDGALNRQYAGTGLGLALVKQIVELHGGRVNLTSELGVGSCFSIDLPCTSELILTRSLSVLPITDQDDDSATVAEATPSIPLILLAEDNEANISTISSYLTAKGYRVISAKNGTEAIAMIYAESPDLILMDIQMPEMDGLAAMRQLRKDPRLSKIPIIALTALAMSGDRERCLEAGANDYLSKPVRLKELVITIHQLL